MYISATMMSTNIICI